MEPVAPGSALLTRHTRLAGPPLPSPLQVETPQPACLPEPLMNINSSDDHYIMRISVQQRDTPPTLTSAGFPNQHGMSAVLLSQHGVVIMHEAPQPPGLPWFVCQVSEARCAAH